jgi:hypothetical protein
LPTEETTGVDRIVNAADQAGLVLRAMGRVAIRIHTPAQTDLASRLGRRGQGQQKFTDLDFVSYRRRREHVRPMMEALGYAKRRTTLSTAASERQIYLHAKGRFFVDVFFDKLLVANHPLDFRRRLEFDRPTIPPTDLLLEKLQTVGIAGKDVSDALVLLAGYEVVDIDAADAVDAAYVAGLLSRAWGF